MESRKELTMSENEEMYLVTVARLVEAGGEPTIPISQLAQELSIQPVSANQMVRKLEEAGLVAYTPYKGVALTPEGERLALRILRHRRLWEVFLVENLKIPLDEAEELACRLEHFLPASVAGRLAEFLAHPQVSPQGKPIPELGAEEALRPEALLSQLQIGEQGRVARLEVDAPTRAFLAGEGLGPGALVTLLGVGNNGAILAGVEGRSVFLAKGLASGIWVTPQTPPIAHP